MNVGGISVSLHFSSCRQRALLLIIFLDTRRPLARLWCTHSSRTSSIASSKGFLPPPSRRFRLPAALPTDSSLLLFCRHSLILFLSTLNFVAAWWLLYIPPRTVQLLVWIWWYRQWPFYLHVSTVIYRSPCFDNLTDLGFSILSSCFRKLLSEYRRTSELIPTYRTKFVCVWLAWQRLKAEEFACKRLRQRKPLENVLNSILSWADVCLAIMTRSCPFMRLNSHLLYEVTTFTKQNGLQP